MSISITNLLSISICPPFTRRPTVLSKYKCILRVLLTSEIITRDLINVECGDHNNKIFFSPLRNCCNFITVNVSNTTYISPLTEGNNGLYFVVNDSNYQNTSQENQWNAYFIGKFEILFTSFELHVYLSIYFLSNHRLTDLVQWRTIYSHRLYLSVA